MEKAVRFIRQGIANSFSDCIEVHEDLKDYPELLHPILQHELSHTDNPFTIKDFVLDLSPNGISTFSLIRFMITRPSTWVAMLPFYRHKTRGWVYDLNCLIFWISIIVFLALFISIGAYLL